MAKIELKHLFKDYVQGIHSVSDVNMVIDDCDFIVLVGPSGCGKSTTLRMIAGLEDITSGEILIDGNVINSLHPKDRDIAMVFQNYALYPHMSVYDNMAFGLKVKKITKEEIDKRVKEAADILGLKELLERKPKELSGGQRQRVALGRAIVREAKVFLMDEPLSNLDARLRFQTRAEITKLHKKLKTTMIYVTHDQTEAMTMATKIVVMKDGFVQQIGTPKEVYLKPINYFVAKFMGSPSMNFLKMNLTKEGLKLGKRIFEIPLDIKEELVSKGYMNEDILVGIRPEHIYIPSKGKLKNNEYKFNTQVDISELTGSETLVHFTLCEDSLIAKLNTMDDFRSGDDISLVFDFDKIHFFDVNTQRRIDLNVEELLFKEA
ncbi:sn-glycerol-3-phosphate ABC transporter ATP-binding protein UgpC [Clostridium sp. CCUG 7971]|uniref:ABC transporter ATP-binding protein n=1 Tax=Clostridium sp. CCUG 7971 TaxID=2811414 RepID=UPI001ABBAB73|nr:sn-glycerol-3-phosphate ABC transporter ATP-binding protein UgpC [Clostridium sp. CCUG 7971]MBO3445475.1 sn-glycerol-3-phosphate ABC transporter ATP-binding protein UgpC [Clostridium sp. CCUG 7971]